MAALLKKELSLCLHPAAVSFLLLAALMLVPNYPYYVTFFYTTLGIFFVCLSARENQDLTYMMLLPVKKRDAVKARFAHVLLLELAQLLLAAAMLPLHHALLGDLPNEAGMDANLAVLGFGFLMLGLFNLSFFPRYYRRPGQVGRCFVFACGVELVFVAAAESTTFFVPFMQALDTPYPCNLRAKLIVLAVGTLLFLLLTACAYSRSCRNLEALDL